jgi:hypothetical protein
LNAPGRIHNKQHDQRGTAGRADALLSQRLDASGELGARHRLHALRLGQDAARWLRRHWLRERQERIEKKLAARHLAEGGLVLYDVTSSSYEGHSCPLAQFGHNRDGDQHRPIIVYGVMTDGEGRPVAVEVYAGNTGDPTTVDDQVEKLRERFGLERVVLIGDRGMLTPPQIAKLQKHPAWAGSRR